MNLATTDRTPCLHQDTRARKTARDRYLQLLELAGDRKQPLLDFTGFLEFVERLPEVVVIESFDYRSSALTQGGSHRVSLTLTVIGY